MYTYAYLMGTKTIVVMDDVYDTLKTLKRPGESFSDELRRMSSKGDIMELAGCLKDVISEEDAKKMKEWIERRRGTRIDEVIKRMREPL